MDNNFNPGRLVRDSLKNLVPYQPALYPDVIKLDANEYPFDFPPEIMSEILSELQPQSFTRYPDPMATGLVQEIARCCQVAEDQVLAGSGSDELILNLMLTFGSGNKVVVATPTFSMYGIHARVAGAQVVEVARDAQFELSVDEIVSAGQEAGLVVLCSPNNPTGNSATNAQLEQILDGCSCPVVVDQAYVEFGGADFLPWLDRYPHLVILRTFSKAYGLAGLRVGYLVAWPGVLHYLYKVKQPFNLNVFSQVAARVVLRHRDIFMKQVQQVRAGRDWLREQLGQIPGFKVYASDANYLLFNTGPHRALQVFQSLLQKKVLVRNFGDPLLQNCLRVTVGKKQENEKFLQSLREVIADLEENIGGRTNNG